MTVKPSALGRFEASMVIDYEKWHDGVGYDLDALGEASLDERRAIEALLLSRGTRDWRDVEALAALDTPRAREALRAAMKSPDAEVRTAVTRHAPGLVPDDERTRSLVEALGSAAFYGGLTQALREAETFHPPEVIDALVRGARDREGEVAVHFAAMLFFLRGIAKEPFDWDHRPFFLRFAAPPDAPDRAAAYRELLERIGVAAG